MRNLSDQNQRASKAERRSTVTLLFPALFFLTVLSIWPLGYLFYASFTSYQLAIPVPIRFVGFDNFIHILQNVRFWNSLWVTAAFALISVPLQLLCGLLVALLLNGLMRGRELYAAILLMPMMLAPIVVGFSWNLFLNPVYGPLNSLLMGLGFDPPAWAQSSAWALPTLILVDTWQWMSLAMIILLAGLQSIPSHIYEAARIDGSSRWQTFVHVMLPMLKPYLAVACILRFIDSFKAFDIIYTLTRGGPGTATQNLAYYTYDLGFGRFEFGRAGALSILQLMILIVGTLMILKLSNRRAPAHAQSTAESRT